MSELKHRIHCALGELKIEFFFAVVTPLSLSSKFFISLQQFRLDAFGSMMKLLALVKDMDA